jgi:hypothetical protein
MTTNSKVTKKLIFMEIDEWGGVHENYKNAKKTRKTSKTTKSMAGVVIQDIKEPKKKRKTKTTLVDCLPGAHFLHSGNNKN